MWKVWGRGRCFWANFGELGRFFVIDCIFILNFSNHTPLSTYLLPPPPHTHTHLVVIYSGKNIILLDKRGTLGCSTFFSSINSNFDSDYVRQWKDRSFLGSCFCTCHWIFSYMILVEQNINRT
jgi:hypothetical protein